MKKIKIEKIEFRTYFKIRAKLGVSAQTRGGIFTLFNFKIKN